MVLNLLGALRAAKGPFREHLLARVGPAAPSDVETFIEWLLRQQGDEQRIIVEAAISLLRGEGAPPDAFTPAAAKTDPDKFPVDLIQPLREAVEANGLKPAKLAVVVLRDSRRDIQISNRSLVPISDGETIMEWSAPTLSQLFRGDHKPPQDMDHYPEQYVPYFFFIEKHLITLFQAAGERTDQEMEEVFSMLRRRPDGPQPEPDT